jgi:hypothetical protein
MARDRRWYRRLGKPGLIVRPQRGGDIHHPMMRVRGAQSPKYRRTPVPHDMLALHGFVDCATLSSEAAALADTGWSGACAPVWPCVITRLHPLPITLVNASPAR